MDKTGQSKPFIALCPASTRSACPTPTCDLQHFVPALRPHTLVSLGDCSYLNTCHRIDSCRYIHWTLQDLPPSSSSPDDSTEPALARRTISVTPRPSPLPPQWLNVDLRFFDVSVLGLFDVLVADPPWAIHQDLPYGTLTDDEMIRMPVGRMQSEGGLLFLWVTGRAMELGRSCLDAWGSVSPPVETLVPHR